MIPEDATDDDVTLQYCLTHATGDIREFIESVEAFYGNKGYITGKQQDALENIEYYLRKKWK